MQVLVAGASGATGRLLVQHLLDQGRSVRAIARSPDRLPEHLKAHNRLTVIQASILEISEADMARHVRGCAAAASCLGHNMTLKGMFGRPRRLVTEATRKLCNAIKASNPDTPAKLVLMNSAGVRNRDLSEPVSIGHRCAVAALRLLLPPHADNEHAADYLRTEIGQNNGSIEWAVVRPDTLTNENEVTEYEAHPSPTRSAVFNAGRTSRINAAAFMASLITNDELWNKWKGRMPVIYNKAPTSPLQT